MCSVISLSTLLNAIVLCLTIVAQSDAACPPGKHQFTNCTNPCLAGEDTVLCESDRTASCRPDYCGGCIARFLNGVGQEVHCETEYGFICELKSHTVGCLDKPGTVLHVSYANYGRTSKKVCVHPFGLERLHNTTTCGSPRALGVLRRQCEGRTQCTLTADNDLFGEDPCFGIYKYLEVEVECVLPKGTSKAAQSSTSYGFLMMTSFLLVLVRINLDYTTDILLMLVDMTLA
ncbi:L-rhamnose-binding lectin CSL3-like [Mizuhopecten yessoensis]|uniref:Latrophilin-2 n=1 Tax=Mizuhopecten yessoensis TaxID=6573 RepID=A0A210R3N3_MIZYE|nr:L-rhamnose-binding lectin CSL3-like [Mizuhopecten yessoensis]OWF55597.1 Latrophilin-2 [Mizuhopecten yessoensis]